MMRIARYGRIIAGVALGSVSAFLTYHIHSLIPTMDSNPTLVLLRRAAFAMMLPGMAAELFTGLIYVSPWWTIAAINFVFWFGFGWLFATFVSKLIKLRRAIAAVGAPGDGSSSLGSE